MAVKKKEKVNNKRQSDISGSRKGINAATAPQLANSKVERESQRVNAQKSKTNNSAKMKNSDEQKEKEAKQKLAKVPFMQSLADAGQFLSEVQAEARKISWPDRNQVIQETISVLFLVALITLFVWIFDLAVAKFVFAPLEHWGHLYGIGR